MKEDIVSLINNNKLYKELVFTGISKNGAEKRECFISSYDKVNAIRKNETYKINITGTVNFKTLFNLSAIYDICNCDNTSLSVFVVTDAWNVQKAFLLSIIDFDMDIKNDTFIISLIAVCPHIMKM